MYLVSQNWYDKKKNYDTKTKNCKSNLISEYESDILAYLLAFTSRASANYTQNLLAFKMR